MGLNTSCWGSDISVYMGGCQLCTPWFIWDPGAVDQPEILTVAYVNSRPRTSLRLLSSFPPGGTGSASRHEDLPGPPKEPKIMAQYSNIESIGSIGSIILAILEVQVVDDGTPA